MVPRFMNLWMVAASASVIWPGALLAQDAAKGCRVVFADGTVVQAEVAGRY